MVKRKGQGIVSAQMREQPEEPVPPVQDGPLCIAPARPCWWVPFAPQQPPPTSRPAPQSAVSLCQRYRDLWATLLLLSAAAAARAGERHCLIWLSFVISKVARSGWRQTRWQGRGGGIDARDRGKGAEAGEEIDAAC